MAFQLIWYELLPPFENVIIHQCVDAVFFCIESIITCILTEIYHRSINRKQK